MPGQLGLNRPTEGRRVSRSRQWASILTFATGFCPPTLLRATTVRLCWSWIVPTDGGLDNDDRLGDGDTDGRP